MSLSRILIVDDSKSALETMEILLELEGYEVRIAENGEEGVAMALEFEPELVLMDLQMPVMDGYEAARAILARPTRPQPILVALSGWEPEKVKERVLAAGFDRMLYKPVSPDDIRALLAAY